MKTTVDLYDFHEAFRRGRDTQFSDDGLDALFYYLEDVEHSTGEEIELDVIALCCDYNEYENLEAFRAAHGDGYETIEDIERDTTVIRINWGQYDEDGAFIAQAF